MNLFNVNNVLNKPILCGMPNMGNSCYLTSSLVCMFNQPCIRECFGSLVTEFYQPINDHQDYQLLKNMMMLFNNVIGNNPTEVERSTRRLWKIVHQVMPKYQEFQQADMHEFLLDLMQEVERQIARLAGDNHNIVNQLRNACLVETKHRFVCQNDHLNNTNESMFSIFLGIEGVQSLEEALRKYVDWRQLSRHEYCFCKTCSRLDNGSKTCELSRLPRTLILVLQRFVESNNDGVS